MVAQSVSIVQVNVSQPGVSQSGVSQDHHLISSLGIFVQTHYHSHFAALHPNTVSDPITLFIQLTDPTCLNQNLDTREDL